MKEVVINPTRTTFSVTLSFTRGEFYFSGNSFPENAYEFFQPIIYKLKMFLKNSRKSLKVVFNVNYFNTSSSKYIFKIMELFEQYGQSGNEVIVQWHFISGEEDMLETWQEIMDDLELEYELIKS